MATLMQTLTKGIADFNAATDQRNLHWPFMSSPIPLLIIIGLYLTAVKWGPKFMEKRPPYDVDRLVQVYNIIQVVICGYLSVLGIYVYGFSGRFKLFCERVDLTSTDNWSIFLLKHCYIYFLLKLLDLMDTIFFVLRKKNSQITFLHVYHHGIMTIGSWMVVRFFPGGLAGVIGFINSIVHTVMYSYYFLTNWKKEYRKNIWWKKHVTQLQLFLLFFLYALPHIMIPDCTDVPQFLIQAVCVPQVLLFSYLFLRFYRTNYLKFSQKDKKEDDYNQKKL